MHGCVAASDAVPLAGKSKGDSGKEAKKESKKEWKKESKDSKKDSKKDTKKDGHKDSHKESKDKDKGRERELKKDSSKHDSRKDSKRSGKVDRRLDPPPCLVYQCGPPLALERRAGVVCMRRLCALTVKDADSRSTYHAPGTSRAAGCCTCPVLGCAGVEAHPASQLRVARSPLSGGPHLLQDKESEKGKDKDKDKGKDSSGKDKKRRRSASASPPRKHRK